jgi:hypothetical protein
VFKEFEYLLEKKAGPDTLVQWFKKVVERYVINAAKKRRCPVRQVARHFLLTWVTVGTRVLRELTVSSMPSIGES